MDEKKTTKAQYYRLNLNLPLELKDYVQEMTWRTRAKSTTAYIAALIKADMELHPEWVESFDPSIK